MYMYMYVYTTVCKYMYMYMYVYTTVCKYMYMYNVRVWEFVSARECRYIFNT